MGLYLGGLIIGGIFASVRRQRFGGLIFGRAFFFFWGGGGVYFRNFTVFAVYFVNKVQYGQYGTASFSAQSATRLPHIKTSLFQQSIFNTHTKTKTLHTDTHNFLSIYVYIYIKC